MKCILLFQISTRRNSKMHFSTVSRSDVYAVLMDLAGVLADYMAQGRSVKIDGLGTFYYTITAGGNGVDSPDV